MSSDLPQRKDKLQGAKLTNSPSTQALSPKPLAQLHLLPRLAIFLWRAVGAHLGGFAVGEFEVCAALGGGLYLGEMGLVWVKELKGEGESTMVEVI